MYTFVPAPYGGAPPWAGGPPAPWMGGGGGGKGKRPQQFCSKESYFESLLRPEDAEGYGGAGLLLYRKGDSGVEVLVASEKPWNPLANDYDPLAWNPLGGKKTPWAGEWEAAATTGRCLMEVFGGCEGAPTRQKIEQLCRSAPVMWYPAGRFALYVRELTSDDGEVFAEAPKLFADCKENGRYPHSPEEQGRVNAKGQPTQRWVKQIEELEWVPAADLLASEKRKPLTDLMKNLCLIESFVQFLQEGSTPAAPPPPPADGAGDGEGRRKGGKDFKGGGKSGGKDGGKKGGGKGKDKGGKGKGGPKGKGMPYASFAPMPPPPMNPQMYPIEMQRQMLGEKLYMTVQPMVPSPMIAQKVTGMLLELPMPELMPLLGPGQAESSLLKQRVDEALEVLEAEDFAAANP